MNDEKLRTLKFVVQYAINPEMRMTRKEIFSFIIFSVLLNERKLDTKSLKEAIKNEFEIDLPNLILDQTLDKLEGDGLIECVEFSQEKRKIAFRIVEHSEKIIRYKDTLQKYHQKIAQMEEWFFSQLGKYYTKELDMDAKERLKLDFFTACRLIAWKYAQEIRMRTHDEEPENWPYITYTRQEAPELRYAMDRILKDLWRDRTTPIVREFLNLAVFWNIFTSLLPYSPTTRDFLREKTKNLQLFLDTNVIVSAICHNDRFHYICRRFLSYLQDAKIDICYLTETHQELLQLLEGINTAIEVLNSYPYEAARLIAKNTGNPMLIGFYEEKYRTWEQYYSHFMEHLSSLNIYLQNTQELAGKFKFSVDKIQNPDLVLVESLVKKLRKVIPAARHDAGLLTLVRLIRQTYRKEGHDWYVHWILTLDTGLRNRDKELTTEKGKHEWPACIHVLQIPLIFEPYALAESILKDINSIDDMGVYKSIQAISMISADTVGTSLIDAMKSLETEEDVTDQLVKYLREMCWEEIADEEVTLTEG